MQQTSQEMIMGTHKLTQEVKRAKMKAKGGPDMQVPPLPSKQHQVLVSSIFAP